MGVYSQLAHYTQDYIQHYIQPLFFKRNVHLYTLSLPYQTSV
nr:MAG TPA: hypothetical protein [Caudoviricetes sp.]